MTKYSQGMDMYITEYTNTIRLILNANKEPVGMIYIMIYIYILYNT